MNWFTHYIDHSEVLKYKSGDIIFRTGDPVHNVFWVQKGNVTLRRPLSHGEFITLNQATTGNLLAEASLFSRHYHCEAQATKPTILHTYRLEDVHQCLQINTEFTHRMGQQLASEIISLRAKLELANILSAKEKVLTWIRLHAEEQGIIKLGRSLKSVASELGIAHETLYRTLKTLESESIITRRHGEICLAQ